VTAGGTATTGMMMTTTAIAVTTAGAATGTTGAAGTVIEVPRSCPTMNGRAAMRISRVNPGKNRLPDSSSLLQEAFRFSRSPGMA
jgi:hypothetical protein